MKETGLMFKAPLVRAILEGRKTQTRRVAKPVKHPDLGNLYTPGALVMEREPQHVIDRACPLGRPGDRIYVRETWNPDPPCDGTWAYTQWAGCHQGQIEGVPEQFRTPEHCMYAASTDAELVWTPSVHMPKWAARIWLEITGVRVERLQQIIEADAKAEGAQPWPCDHPRRSCADIGCNGPDYLAGFRHIWESTGGDWDANPWVWVIDFKTISTTGRPA
jgi:hypothetical protein